jgi:pimeloyl-ACP methyl ester carboxylesterase
VLRLILAIGLLVVLLLAALRGLAWAREDGTAVPPTSTLVPTSLGRVAVSLSGPENGPAILLIHGSAAWSGFWRDISHHLAGRGWRVVAVDLPPFGYSDHDPGRRYDRNAQARRLSDVIARVAGGKVVVVGHSFGGGPSTELALRRPDQVRRLVLVDAALGAFDPPPGKSAIERSARVRPLAEALTSATITNPYATGALLRSFIARKETAAPWLETIRQPMGRSGTTIAYAAWLPALFQRDDGAWSRSRARLRGIRVPVSIIWGDADTVTPPWQGREIAQLTKAQHFRLLKQVGHIPHIEAPREFLAALNDVTGGEGKR